MNSGHFFFVIMDVEGKVLKSNGLFEKIAPRSTNREFWNFLSLDTAEEFCYSLELMLGAPKIRRHLMLEHPLGNQDSFSQIWWEFSVVTTPEGDISSVIGIGVGIQLLEDEMPWDNLVDVLGFGKLVLDRRLRITSWDSRVESWFVNDGLAWKNKDLLQTAEFGDDPNLFSSLQKLLEGENPVFFTFIGNQREFAGLLYKSGQEFHFFMGPKEKKPAEAFSKRIFSQKEINLIPGAVFILDKDSCLVQQNQSALEWSEVLFGNSWIEGENFDKSGSSIDSVKLKYAINEALEGKPFLFEIRRLSSGSQALFWDVTVNPIFENGEEIQGVFIHIWNNSTFQNQVLRLHQENEKLRSLALQPSHILRGPLSSMLGILDLIDFKSLSEDNKKLISYLKPLAEDLDQKIREHAKKTSNL